MLPTAEERLVGKLKKELIEVLQILSRNYSVMMPRVSKMIGLSGYFELLKFINNIRVSSTLIVDSGIW